MKNSIKLIALAVALTSAVACGTKKTSEETTNTDSAENIIDSANAAANNMIDSASQTMENAADSAKAQVDAATDSAKNNMK